MDHVITVQHHCSHPCAYVLQSGDSLVTHAATALEQGNSHVPVHRHAEVVAQCMRRCLESKANTPEMPQ
jgi:hypothetical protein